MVEKLNTRYGLICGVKLFDLNFWQIVFFSFVEICPFYVHHESCLELFFYMLIAFQHVWHGSVQLLNSQSFEVSINYCMFLF